MNEVCFCGWSGELADREPTYLGEGEWGLKCPCCGHLDRLDWLPAAARDALIAEARCRRVERLAADDAELQEGWLLAGQATAAATHTLPGESDRAVADTLAADRDTETLTVGSVDPRGRHKE